ncbi:MAG TPA: restriction endonuclease [Dissulfurispiraceae bacterium]|nr:restriction endonuclease [Dissulfurispiraceae bacterium]
MQTITKSSGIQEDFQLAKLIDSLMRAGAPQDIAARIADDISRQMPQVAHSKHIYKIAKRLLRKYNRASGMRYSLKKAIYSLGPSGFPFERYFAKVLSHHGYSTQTNVVVKGYCVSHEVDVIAQDASGKHMIECKYHNDPGKNTDVKVALYIHARFQDIKKEYERAPEKNGIFSQGWLVTNTRCSGDAIAFAECAGLKIISWRYPEDSSLEKMIEEKHLYPITVLQFPDRRSLEACIAHDIILAKDIAVIPDAELAAQVQLNEATVRSLKKQVSELCIESAHR